MAEWLREFVEARMAAEASRSPQDRAWVEESGGMLLYGTIGAEAYMRPDGSVRIHHDHGEAREEWGWKDASEP